MRKYISVGPSPNDVEKAQPDKRCKSGVVASRMRAHEDTLMLGEAFEVGGFVGKDIEAEPSEPSSLHCSQCGLSVDETPSSRVDQNERRRGTLDDLSRDHAPGRVVEVTVERHSITLSNHCLQGCLPNATGKTARVQAQHLSAEADEACGHLLTYDPQADEADTRRPDESRRKCRQI